MTPVEKSRLLYLVDSILAAPDKKYELIDMASEGGDSKDYLIELLKLVLSKDVVADARKLKEKLT